MAAKVICLDTFRRDKIPVEVIIFDKDPLRSFVNPRMRLEADHAGVWMRVCGETHAGTDPYLWIRKDKNKHGGYSVRGVYGWAGMGYDGPISTRSLIQGLRRLGFRIDARQLRGLFLKAPVR